MIIDWFSVNSRSNYRSLCQYLYPSILFTTWQPMFHLYDKTDVTLLVWELLRTGNLICVFVRLQQKIIWVFQLFNWVFTQIRCLSGALYAAIKGFLVSLTTQTNTLCSHKQQKTFSVILQMYRSVLHGTFCAICIKATIILPSFKRAPVAQWVKRWPTDLGH